MKSSKTSLLNTASYLKSQSTHFQSRLTRFSIFSAYLTKRAAWRVLFSRDCSNFATEMTNSKLLSKTWRTLRRSQRTGNWHSMREDSCIEHAHRLLIKTTSQLLHSKSVLRTLSSSISVMIKSLQPSRLRMRLRDAYSLELKYLLLSTSLTSSN